jgi:hypothetical protein
VSTTIFKKNVLAVFRIRKLDWGTMAQGKSPVGKQQHIHATVKPDVKQRAENLLAQDTRFGSMSSLVNAALALYLREYDRAGGRIDKDSFPDPPDPSGPSGDTHKRDYVHGPRARTRP